MPELPEVETVCRGLQQTILGKRIQKVLVRETRLRVPVNSKRLEKLLPDEEILNVSRRSKYIIVHLSGQQKILVHLGMSGQLTVQQHNEDFKKHDHIIISISDGLQLCYHDPRRFGLFEVLTENEFKIYPRLLTLGLEPLDKKTTAKVTWPQVKKSKKPIKNLLMDANFIVGVGNIYANEALYFAQIHPQKMANELTARQWEILLQQVQLVLRNAIQLGGTTLNDFVNSTGESGYFQLELAVYGRENEPCKICKEKITRVVQSGRSSFFCPRCQAA
ncbi:MAG: bifunctional DNA-formamidopyrimidine glycosylase/DNA-(apurinic or apyrimidinic site) lyase [Calditrichaeota bacterium]|nr:MAG: bifunctional DNA-formamidopyrimidine glycosylase/DNA-(apurinic or apyrimidinic site) lyase [Calditrichota bacterium]